MRLLVMLLLAAAGCTGVKGTRHLKPDLQAPPEAWSGVARIAVLPPDNWTTEIGLEYIPWYRAVMNEMLRERGYAPTPLVDVNRFMLRNRFMFAGEVKQYEFRELAEALGADALLYWNITGPEPKLELFLVKADGTDLWATGEARLSLKFNAHPKARYQGKDHAFALALSEILRRMPERQP